MASFVSGEVLVNEFLAHADPSTNEWIELYNNGGSSVFLDRLNISDDNGNATLNLTIGANSFVVLSRDFVALNQTYPGINDTGIVFEYGGAIPLLDGGETITLYNDSIKLDNVSYSSDPGESISIGRFPDGTSNIISLAVQTPGAANDNLAPVFNSWLNGLSNNSNVSGIVNITVNITDQIYEVNTSFIEIGSSNFSMDKDGDLWNFTWNTLLNTDGRYNITIYFNDSVGLSDTNTLFDITVDNTIPAGSNEYPANHSFINIQSNILINLTINDSTAKVDPSSINFTIPNLVNEVPSTQTDISDNGVVTSYLLSGPFFSGTNFTVIVKAEDFAGNAMPTIFWSFAIDSVNPKVKNISTNDSDSKVKSSTQFNLTVNATDALAGVSIVNASNTNTISLSQLASGDIWSVKTDASELGCTSEGNCTITVSAYDAAGNVNSSEKLTLVVDNSAPNVSNIIVNDADNKVRSTDLLLFNVTLNDTNFDLGSTVTIGNSSTVPMGNYSTVGQTTKWNLTITPSSLGCASDGLCTLRLIATDVVGNIDSSKTLNLTIDNTAPNVSISINDSDFNVRDTTVLAIIINATDTNAVSNVSINGTPLINAAGSIWNTTNATHELCPGVIDSTCTLTATVFDEVGNSNSSQTLTLTISSFSPTISGIPDVTFNEDGHNATLNLTLFITDEDTSINDITVSVLNNVNVTVSINQTTKIANISAGTNFNGSENIVFLASDGVNSDSDNIKVTVSPVNDAPTTPTLTSPANNSNVSTTNTTLSWSASTDPDEGNSITYFVFFSNDTAPKFNTTTTDTNITVNNLTKSTTYFWLVIAGDGSLNSSNSSKFQFLEVSNRIPVLNSSISNVTLTEDTADTSIDLDNHFSDEDNDVLTFTSTTPSNISVSIDSTTHVVTLTPNSNFVGTNTITFTANDGTNSTSSNEVTLTVTNVNDAPTINSFSPAENKTIAADVGSQRFEVVFADVDAGDKPISAWFRNGASIGPSNASNVTVSGLVTGTYNVSVIITDNASATARYEWKLTVTGEINSTELTSPVLSLNELERQNATNVAINQTTFGGIDFGANTLNFSGVVNLEDAFNISNGLISVDSNNFPGLNKSASLSMKGLNFTKTPLIFTSSGFKSTSNGVLCTNATCTGITYNTANGILRFNVAHFTTFFAQTNTTNGAPVITSNAATAASLNEQYRYDVDATDPDGNTLAFSLTTSPSGMSINSGSGLITFTPTSLGNFSVSVQVSDGNLTDSQSYNLTVGEGARLRITDLDIKVGSKTDKNVQNNSRISKEAEPGDKIEFDLEIKNFFTNDEDLEIEDIDVEITIEDIDDGDDLDNDAKEFDLKAGKDDNVKIDFEVPLDIDEDTFDVFIEVEGRDENGTIHEILWILQLEVEKENHEIRVLRAVTTPSQVICQRTISINTEIINTGADDEDDVTLEILSSELGINSVTDAIELDEGTDDNRFTKLVTATIDNDIAPGIYPVAVNSYYDGKLSDTDTIDLEVRQCELTKDVKEPVKEQPKVVVTTPQSGVSEQPEKEIEISFVNTDAYYILLSVMIVIFLGTAAFVIGAAFIVLRK